MTTVAMKPLSFCVGQYDTTANFRRDLDRAKAIKPGCQIRLDCVWRYQSNSAGTVFNWTSMDSKINDCTSRGLGVNLMIPMWCPDGVLNGAPDKTQIKTTPALNLFKTFVSAVAARYGSNATVKCCSTGNEPNNKNPFAPDGADPAWQARVTNEIRPLLPAAWKVYSPGMAPATTGNGSMAPLDYLNVYWPALTVSLDGCEMHPYGRAADVAQPWSTLGKLTAIHNLAGVPVIASEYNSDWNDSDAVTATNVPKGLDYMASLPFVERVFIYAMSDKATDGDFHLGMIDGAGNNRPLYATVAAWAATHA